MSAAIVVCVFEGELGKGKCITAFACGGGRGGAGGGGVILSFRFMLRVDGDDEDEDTPSDADRPPTTSFIFLDNLFSSLAFQAASHLSFHMISNIPRCSSAALICAAVGNGARS